MKGKDVVVRLPRDFLELLQRKGVNIEDAVRSYLQELRDAVST